MKVFIILAFAAVAVSANLRNVDLAFGFPVPEGRPMPDGFIVGGSNANIANFPYQLSMRRNGAHSCGASIISGTWALTAAHCVPGVPASQITFRAGSSNRSSGGILRNADLIISHPNYNSRTMDNDAALVRVTQSFSGTNVASIPLAALGASVATGTRVTVSGWGTTVSGGSTLPEILQQVSVPVVDQNQCNSALASFGGITANMLCAGEGGRDSCQGDSGGPLVSGGRLIGIVSWGASCADARWPGVYARVAAASVRNFIRDNTGL